MKNFKEHDVVVLKTDLTSELKKGMKGTIVYVYNHYKYLEVEFNDGENTFVRVISKNKVEKSE